MRYLYLLVAGTAWLGALGCGDGVTEPAPGGDGRRLARQFERLADSVADSGYYSPTAEALRHAAEIVRLTGHATPVTLTIDGATRNFLSVAEQLDFPELQCSWPSDSGVVTPGDSVVVPPVDSTGVVPPDGGGAEPPDTIANPPSPPECTVVGTYSMRTLIAWEPENMAEVMRIVAYVGSNGVNTGVPDVMTGLPAAGDAEDPAPGDSAAGWYPGFMGEYLVRDVGSWWAVEGRQSNALQGTGGACTEDRATIDWAEFSCEAARFRFEFSMRVEAPRYADTGVLPPAGGAEGSHTLELAASSVDGVRLAVVAWMPPPPPPVPGPVDSILAGR